MKGIQWIPVELEPGFKPMANYRPLSYRFLNGDIELQGSVEAPDAARDGDLVGRLPQGPVTRLGPERILVDLNEGGEGAVIWTRYSVETDGRILYWPMVPDGYKDEFSA